ncbi:major histocompatibility complex class I-related gene protein-like [Sardina pilchardus]|uniref:major histocompatibility complex class I-related gene protein-like n=1 Tax=Sardina pilchardus TaxID=27697 RepID=UPI002E10EE92
MGCVLKLSMLLICLPLSTTLTHRLQYFYTATSGVPHIPEFISVGMVDGVDFSYYDNINKRSVPRQTWMEQINEEDPDYWGSETHLATMYEQIFRKNIEILGKRFNHTGGVHVLQKTYGCQWDDNTGATDGHEALGYDGEDFLILDLENMRWIAVVPQAVPSKLKWDNTEHFLNRDVYFKETCVEWLKRYVDYGSSTLERKVPPDVSVFQRNSSAVCHATGFYPEGVVITWKRDGEEMQEDVDVGETLPNMDGTFQKRAVLTVSPERRKSQYTCEVEHISREPIIRTLSEEDGKFQYHTITLIIIGGVVIVIVIAVKTCCEQGDNKTQRNTTRSRKERNKKHTADIFLICCRQDICRLDDWEDKRLLNEEEQNKKHTADTFLICCRQDIHRLDYWKDTRLLNEEEQNKKYTIIYLYRILSIQLVWKCRQDIHGLDY